MNCNFFVILNLLKEKQFRSFGQVLLKKHLTLKAFTFRYFAKLVKNKEKLKSCDDTTAIKLVIANKGTGTLEMVEAWSTIRVTRARPYKYKSKGK